MGKNTGRNYRIGAVRGRSQTYNPKTNQWVERNTETGQFINVKTTGGKFKGVTDETK